MHHSDGSLSTAVYHKKTRIEKFLAYDSKYPPSHKIAVAKRFLQEQKTCSVNIRKEEE